MIDADTPRSNYYDIVLIVHATFKRDRSLPIPLGITTLGLVLGPLCTVLAS